MAKLSFRFRQVNAPFLNAGNKLDMLEGKINILLSVPFFSLIIPPVPPSHASPSPSTFARNYHTSEVTAVAAAVSI